MRLACWLDRRQPDPAELGSATIQRILVVSCTAIGDTLMSTPAIRSLRLAYPHAHLTLLIHPAYRSCLPRAARRERHVGLSPAGRVLCDWR